MYFGLYTALETFQRLINLTFADMLNEFVAVSLDNTLIYSEA